MLAMKTQEEELIELVADTFGLEGNAADRLVQGIKGVIWREIDWSVQAPADFPDSYVPVC